MCLIVTFKYKVRKCPCVTQLSALGSYPRPLAPISSALDPQTIARLNAIPLFNFEVVITLKL